ncbi:MAG: nicotinate-nucleotide adenylyltransferase [Leptolyngbyaceae bacterium]|nr:nicotinate-nucleotide adenylyltransferase [Leptolyngbyaceae bacterium]
MLSIALFGTSADPPTAGHQQILNWLSYHYDEVWVWASDNPFKQHQTSLAHRASMLKLLIDDIHPPRSNICCDQTLSDPKALITVERAQHRWPHAELTLVVGSDLIGKVSSWYRATDLLQQVKLLVIPRPGYAIKTEDVRHLQSQGGDVAIADMTGPPVSSTAYRRDQDPNAVTPPVQAYIHQQQLYECQDPSKSTLPTR